VILYIGQIAHCIESGLRRSGHPYGLYVIGDPLDVYAPGAIKHPLRPFLRWWAPRQVRRQCADACAVAYVSKVKLHRRYPPAPGAFSTYFCIGEMPDEAFVTAPRPLCPQARALNLIFVGSLAQLYKAPDVLIDAVAACVQGGLDLRLTIVGDGRHRAELEAQAAALGLEQRVRFLGRLPAGAAVREQMDRADLLVLPSRAEALGQVIVEAMARGLPCIGSTAGGIPEMLPPEDLVPPDDIAALARKIREVVSDPHRMARMSARNLEKAREYHETPVNERRVSFCRSVKARTQAWLEGQP
jgi:glycosyltransferase involved in cell wall biosynthesis